MLSEHLRMANSESSGFIEKNAKNSASIFLAFYICPQSRFAIFMWLSEAEDPGLFFVDFIFGKSHRFWTTSRQPGSHGFL